MFKRYDRTYHLPFIPEVAQLRRTLDPALLQQLLSGKVYIEEKVDGANSCIIRHRRGFHLQKRGSLVGPSEHAQFQRLWAWANQEAYDKIMSLPGGLYVYGEWLFAVHHLFYDRLPDYFLVFDIWSEREQRWMDRDEREELCFSVGFHQVPLVAQGRFTPEELVDLIPEASEYGPVAEGVVVKRYGRRDYLRGKLVKPGFIKGLDEDDHWTHQAVRENQLAPKQETP